MISRIQNNQDNDIIILILMLEISLFVFQPLKNKLSLLFPHTCVEKYYLHRYGNLKQTFQNWEKIKVISILSDL